MSSIKVDQSIVVINLPRRVDRRLETEKELARIGWRATFFPAVEPASPGGFPSTGARGCFLSHLAVLRGALETRVRQLVILEDDINFVRDFASQWQSASAQLEGQDWSLFYPGHVLDGLPTGLSLLRSTTGVQCAHFLMVNGVAISRLIGGLETILSRPPGHPMGGPMHVDGAYSTIRLQNPDFVTYAYSPTLGYQRPSRTDIGSLKWFDRVGPLEPIVRLIRKAKLRVQSGLPKG